tara:strand:- start:6396 stop:7070 length:675 start_codon:yes stop_codon:yes gene_type:complete
MKLSDYTLTILKNFSEIQKSINVPEGNLLRTISEGSNIIAQAEVDEQFEQEFTIYELSKFLGVLSMFEDSELEFKEQSMQIKSGNSKVKYVYADPAIINKPPEKNIKLPSVDITFTLRESDLSSLLRAARVMDLPDFSVRATEDSVNVVVHDKKNPSTDEYVVEIKNEDVEIATSANVDFKVENIKMIHTDYKIDISSKKIAEFNSTQHALTYWVAAETTTKFG